MLTDAKCRTAKPQAKPYKLSDGQGLYLEVKPNDLSDRTKMMQAWADFLDRIKTGANVVEFRRTA